MHALFYYVQARIRKLAANAACGLRGEQGKINLFYSITGNRCGRREINMKITFEQMQEHGVQGKAGMERAHGTVRDVESRDEKVKKAGTAGAYTVNISGQDMRTQEGTYKKESMTAEEISMQAEQMDMDVQKMYMAVMSNSMSQDEFHKMLEDGYNVSDVDIETIVTILDQIKVAVAKGGGIDGFTDGVSKETLEQILGSSAYAEALESGLEEGAAAYMVEQQMSPTAENIYRAKYSAGVCQRREEKVPDEESPDGKAFWDQIDRVIENAGLVKGEESRADAAFLLRYDIPLTEENLQLYDKLKAFRQDGERPSEEELKSRILMQVYEGKAAYEADLSRTESIYEQAVNIYDKVQKLPPEAAEEAAQNHSEGRDLTLRDVLERGQKPGKVDPEKEEQTLQGTQTLERDAAERAGETEDRDLLTARRQLEEVRLRMTVEVNIKLLRSGFQIDTAPMEQLIERLRAAEEALAGQGVLQAEEAAKKIEELRGMPMAALGYVVSREISFTIDALHVRGSELQREFESSEAWQAKRETANRRYETMQTEVRADLGDSIQKAFRNVDDILADMNREPSEENRRAVRMLGYNRLEISEENLEKALEVDEKVQNLFHHMKPGKVMQMIRDGIDVLHTDIGELDAYLTAQSGSFPEESEEFARFLYRLDKNGGITAEERENYIGIYRLVRQVEKSDGRAQGYLLGSEAELTMENLLSAVRSGKKGTMDYRIDEDFSGVEGIQKGRSIIDQINAAPYVDGTGYEETMRVLQETDQKMRQARGEAVDFLKDVKEPVTVSNLVEASSVLQEDAAVYQKLEDYEKTAKQEEKLEQEQSRLESYVLGLHERMTDEESLQKGMETFAKQAEEILRTAEGQDGVTELDIREMQHVYRGIRFRCALSRESRYQIPVKLESGYTVMNLTVRRGTGAAQAEISIETEEHGRLEALFTESGEVQRDEIPETSISGILYGETTDGVELLRHVAEKVQGRLKNAGIPADDMTVIQGNRIRRGAVHTNMKSMEEKVPADKNGQKEISTGELYQIAKIFLETVRNEW
jgi:hypothetical protein